MCFSIHRRIGWLAMNEWPDYITTTSLRRMEPHTTIRFYALEISLTEWTTIRGAADESVSGERRVLSKVTYG